jgi:hypothetical protein
MQSSVDRDRGKDYCPHNDQKLPDGERVEQDRCQRGKLGVNIFPKEKKDNGNIHHDENPLNDGHDLFCLLGKIPPQNSAKLKIDKYLGDAENKGDSEEKK